MTTGYFQFETNPTWAGNLLTRRYFSASAKIKDTPHHLLCGATEAHYGYDAFGYTIRAEGTMTNAFRHRFSPKYRDNETAHYNYGHRLYAPRLHRFISRDPIEDQGGLNLYGFCGNDPVNKWDYPGMALASNLVGNL